MSKQALKKESTIDDDTLSQVNNFCCGLRVVGRVFSGFMYIFLIIFPWVTEIILVTQQTLEHKILTIVVCGSLQTLVSIYGGVIMGIMWGKCCGFAHGKKKNKKSEDELCQETWCGCPTNYKSLFSAGYVIYWLPGWVATNMIISWALLGAGHALPLHAHIMTYLPLLTYLPFAFAGCAYEKAIEDEGEYVEIV
jgi:hypothetical protein